MGYIKYFFEIGPNGITPDNIREFIAKKKEESSILEYTGADALKNRRELLKEVSAFANSNGGLLIIGISEEEKEKKIYPKEITWSDGSVSREALDQSFNASIDPPIKGLKIVPVRKNKTSSEVIFLIDIPKSKHIPHTVHPSSFYKRLNFGKQPMKRDDIFRLMKERLGFEKCAQYRHWLSYNLHHFMAGVLYYLGGRSAIGENLRDLFEEITKKSDDEIVELMKKANFDKIVKLDRELWGLKKWLDEIKKYPHDEITPDESILLDKLEEYLPSREREISGWLVSEAKLAGWDDKLDTFIEEIMKVDEEFSRYLKGLHIARILETCRVVLRLKKILGEMEEKHGSFYEYVSRVRQD